MRLVHTEEVTGSIPVSPTDVRPAQRLHGQLSSTLRMGAVVVLGEIWEIVISRRAARRRRTGRCRWDQLHKTEKTYTGTLVEVALAYLLRLADGAALDYTIAGSDVDCKLIRMSGRQVVAIFAADSGSSG
jgi:Restriction endonuclease NaeI